MDQFEPAIAYMEEAYPKAVPVLPARPPRAVPVDKQQASSFNEFMDIVTSQVRRSGTSPAPKPQTPVAARSTPAALGKPRIFVVHGHDRGPRDSVARLIEKLGFEAVVLEEQPNKGRTIIEKFESYADVKYAVVVMTPDDMGGAKGGPPARPRARQNVILELGFFIGELGRDHVAAIVVGDKLEIPSDIDGVLYIPFDSSGAWRQRLAREMKAAGLAVDMNRL